MPQSRRSCKAGRGQLRTMPANWLKFVPRTSTSASAPPSPPADASGTCGSAGSRGPYRVLPNMACIGHAYSSRECPQGHVAVRV
jgi:hypothetical protein